MIVLSDRDHHSKESWFAAYYMKSAVRTLYDGFYITFVGFEKRIKNSEINKIKIKNGFLLIRKLSNSKK